MPVELVYPLLVVVLAVAVLADPLVLRLPPRVLQKEEKHGTAGVTVLAEPDFERVKHRMVEEGRVEGRKEKEGRSASYCLSLGG